MYNGVYNHSDLLILAEYVEMVLKLQISNDTYYESKGVCIHITIEYDSLLINYTMSPLSNSETESRLYRYK